MPTERFMSAIGMVSLAHRTQFDKAGKPYVEHLERVAIATAGKLRAHPGPFSVEQIEDICIAAALHDIVEDTAVRLVTVQAIYGSGVAEIVGLVTKQPGRAYQDGITRLASSGNLGAILVKLSDLEDNMDPARRELLPAEQRPVPAKYVHAHAWLTEAAQALGYPAEPYATREAA